MNAPTIGTTGTTRFIRITRSSRTIKKLVHLCIARSSQRGIIRRWTTHRRTAPYRALVPRTSPAIATARRRTAHTVGSMTPGRYVYVTTIHNSGSAGNNAASTAKITRRASRLPVGPREANRAARNSSREAIRGPQSGRLICTIVTWNTSVRPFVGASKSSVYVPAARSTEVSTKTTFPALFSPTRSIIVGSSRWWTRMTPCPPFAASSIERTSPFQAPYGRTNSPGTGLFVNVTMLPATLTVWVQPQNGSVTFIPETGDVRYVAAKSAVLIVTRTGTDSNRGFTTNFVGSAAP